MGSTDISPSARQRMKQAIQLDDEGLPIPQRVSSNIQLDEEGLPIPTSKKKVGTEQLSNGGQNTNSQSPSQSVSPSPLKDDFMSRLERGEVVGAPPAQKSISFLERDLDKATTYQPKRRVGENRTQERTTPAFDTVSLIGANFGVKGEEGVDVKAKSKEVIKSNSSALKEYRKKRVADLDNEAQDLAASKYSVGAFGPAKVVSDEEEGALDNQIKSIQEYKVELHKSVSDTANKIIPKEVFDEKGVYDLQEIGLRKLKTVGDTEAVDDARVLATIDKVGGDKEDVDRTKQSIQYKLYQEGAITATQYFKDLAGQAERVAGPKLIRLDQLIQLRDESDVPITKQSYQSEINRLVQDDEIKSYIDALTQAQKYAIEAETAAYKFPQVKRQQLRQQLNDKFFQIIETRNEKRNPLNPITPLRLAAGAILGETPDDNDIKELAEATGKTEQEVKDIIQGGGVGGAFVNKQEGVRVAGGLTGIAQGVDETIANSIMGIRRFANVDNVDAKNKILADRVEGYLAGGAGSKLIDNGKYNINPYSIFNTMGSGIGQTAVFAAPAMGTGAIAGRLGQAIGTVAAGYAGSYENAYKEAAKYTDDEEVRRSYANVTAFENALPELIMSPAAIARKLAIGKVGKEAAFRNFAKDVAKDGVGKTLAQRIGVASKEFGEVLISENIEEQITNITNNFSKQSQLGVETTPQQMLTQAIETAVATTLTTLPLGIGAGINAQNDVSGIRKETIFEVGNEPETYIPKLEALRDNGVITPEQFNLKVAQVNTMAKAVASSNKATKVDGTPLSYEEKANLAAQEYRIALNNKLKEEGVIAAQEKLIDADNNEAAAIQEEILTKPAVVMPNEINRPTTEVTIAPDENITPETKRSSVAVTLPQSNVEPNIIPINDRVPIEGSTNQAAQVNESQPQEPTNQTQVQPSATEVGQTATSTPPPVLNQEVGGVSSKGEGDVKELGNSGTPNEIQDAPIASGGKTDTSEPATNAPKIENGKVVVDNNKDFSEGYPYLSGNKITEHAEAKKLHPLQKIEWALWRRKLIQDKLDNTRGTNVKNKGVKWANDAAQGAKSREVRELLEARKALDEYIHNQLPNGYDTKLQSFPSYTDVEKRNLAEKGILPKYAIEKWGENPNKEQTVQRSVATKSAQSDAADQQKENTQKQKDSLENRKQEEFDRVSQSEEYAEGLSQILEQEKPDVNSDVLTPQLGLLLEKLTGFKPQSFTKEKKNFVITNNSKKFLARVSTDSMQGAVVGVWKFGDYEVGEKGSYYNPLKAWLDAKYDAELAAIENTQPVNNETKEGFTEVADLNKMYANAKAKYGDKKGAAIYEATNRLVNPNKNTIVDIKSNGATVKEGDKYIFKPFGNTDANSKKWTLYKGIDVTDQYADTSSTVEQNTKSNEGQKDPVRLNANTDKIRRSRTNTIEFKTPIRGKNGSKLLSYTWESKDFGKDKDGKPILFSDWEKAGVNADTGRNIVHKFKVEVDGKVMEVSADSVAKALGFTNAEMEKAFPKAKDFVKQLAKMKMREQALMDELASTDEAVADAVKVISEKYGVDIPLNKEGDNVIASSFGMPKGDFMIGDEPARSLVRAELRSKGIFFSERDNVGRELNRVRNLIKNKIKQASQFGDIDFAEDNAENNSVTSSTTDNAIQVSSTTPLGTYQRGDESSRGEGQSEGVGQQQQGNEATQEGAAKKVKLSKTKASKSLRERANKIRTEGLLPNGFKLDLPEGTQTAGFGGKALDEVVAKAFELVADAIDEGLELAQAAERGFNYLRDYYKENTTSFDEDKLRESFNREVESGVDDDEGTPPPADATKTDNATDKPKMRSVYKNVIERSKLTAKQKEALADDPVAMYYELPNDKAKEIALEIIEEMGVDNAVAEASRKNSALEPFEKVMILGAAMDYYAGQAKAAEKAKNNKDVEANADLELDAQDKMLQVTQELAKLGTSLGRGVNMFNNVYKLSNLALERKLKRDVDELNKLRNPHIQASVEVVKDIIEDESVTGIGESMTQADAQQVADLNTRVSVLEKEIEDLKKQIAANTNTQKGTKKNPLNIKRQTNATEYDKRVKEFTQRHRSGISNEDLADLGYFGLYHIENGLTRFAEWYGTMSKKFSKYKPHLPNTYLSARGTAIQNGADTGLFDAEDEVTAHLDILKAESDAMKMAQLTKRKAIAQFNAAMENNPDRARVQAPRIAAERIRKDAEVNLGMATTKNEQNYLKRLVSVVQAKAREYYKEKKENISNINDILAFAIANGKADYEIWDRTKAEVESQIDADEKLSDDEKQDVKDFLSDYTDSVFETLLTNRQQEELVRQKLIDAGYSTERTVKGKVVKAVDWNKVVANSKNITEAREAIKKAIVGVGFTEDQAKNEINAVLGTFDNKVLEKKQAAINSYLKKGVLNKVKGALGVGNNKTKIQRLVDMNNKGILDDSRVKDVLADELGVISLTDADLKRVRDLSELIDNKKIPAFQRKRFEEELQYLFDSKSGNLTYLEFREFLANNRLTSVYNNIQNLTGWLRGISTYITIAAKTGSPLQAAKVARKAFKESISDAMTILLHGDVSRGTSFSDLTRSTEGEPRVRYLEKGKGKLLGLPDAYVKVGSKTFNANILNTAYKGIKYVARILESADTVPSNVISGLTQYWQIRKQFQILHPEWSNKQVEAETYKTMYAVPLAEATKEAMEGFDEAGVTPSKYQLNRAVHEISERRRNEILAKEFYDTVEKTKGKAKQRLITNGIATPTDEQITEEAYKIIGRDEPLDIVARGERQALRETGKKSTFGVAGLLLWPVNAFNEKLKRGMLQKHDDAGRWAVNAGDAAMTYLLPYANSIGRWIEMGIELSPYGVLKGAMYKMGMANRFEGLAKGNITKDELSEMGDDYIIRGIQGSTMLLTAMYMMSLLKDGDDDEEDLNVTGTYKNPSFPKERIQSVGKPDQTLTIGGHKIPLGLMGNASYPLIMYQDFLDKRTFDNEKHGILYTTAAVYLVTAAQSVGSRLTGYGSIIGGIQSGKEERYMPQLGKMVGSNAAASLIPFNRLQQEVSQLWNPKSEQSLTFGENLLQQFSIVGAISKEHPSFDYRGREYDFGEIYTGSADGIVKMFEKSKRADKIDRKLAEIDFGATDAFRESKDEENYKYTISERDGSKRFMTLEEYYDFKKATSQKFNEKLLRNFDIVDKIEIKVDGEVDENETKKVMNDTYSDMFTAAKEQALDLVQAKTGYMPNRIADKRESKKEKRSIMLQKKRQLRGVDID